MKKSFDANSAQLVFALTQAALEVAQQHGVDRYDTLVIRDMATAIKRVVDEFAKKTRNNADVKSRQIKEEKQK